MSEVIMGEEYEDITGWTGVATARTVYIDGKVKVALERARDGLQVEWFEESRLKSLAARAVGVRPRTVPAPSQE